MKSKSQSTTRKHHIFATHYQYRYGDGRHIEWQLIGETDFESMCRDLPCPGRFLLLLVDVEYA
jgi:hypothetical protein